MSWRTRRLNNSTEYLPPVVAISTLQKRRNENCWRIITSVLPNCPKVYLIFYVNLHDQTKICDKRLNRLISKIHHTCECKQHSHVGNTAKQCRLGLFQNSDFAGDLEDSKSTSGRTLCVLGSHTFVPISWMCKTQNFCFTQFNRI